MDLKTVENNFYSCASIYVSLNTIFVGISAAKISTYVKVSSHAYMEGDEIKISNHPILDSSDVFCVQGD